MRPGQRGFIGSQDVSRETLARLELFTSILGKWTSRINLISSTSFEDLWHRHIADSAQLLDIMPPASRTWCDLGSGAGFPGLVVAIMANELRPSLSVTLIEADQRKCAFLRTVSRETGCPVMVIPKRIEAAEPQNADIVSARALAPLPALLTFAARHVSAQGLGLFPKGAGYRAELAQALALWDVRCETLPSKTDPDAVILKVSELSSG